MKISYFKNTRLFTSVYLVLTFLTFLSFTGCTEEIIEVKVEEKFCLNEFMKDNVDVETVTSLPVTETIHLTGNVEYNPDHVVEFISFVGGVITNTYFTLGDAVKKGQLLAEIESTELSSLLAQKKSHQAQILVAKRAYESSITLYEDEIVSEKDLIESKSNLDVLIAELENTEAQLNMYSASNERGVFQIKAPSSGTIVAVPSSALLFDNNQHFLLIYNHDCEIEARAVEPIAQNSVHVFFDNNLEVGEKVITKNNLLIYNKIKK